MYFLSQRLQKYTFFTSVKVQRLVLKPKKRLIKVEILIQQLYSGKSGSLKEIFTDFLCKATEPHIM